MLTTSLPPSLSLPSYLQQSVFQRLQPWIVIFASALFFFFEFMQLNMFNAIDPSLYRAYHLTNTTVLGELSACYMYANVIFLFPAGMILDRYSPRIIILVAMLASVICALLFSLTHALWEAELCRFITGIGGSFCLLAPVRIASRWFPAKRMALVIGLIVTFAMMGGMVAQTPFTKMTEVFGWRETLRIDAMVGLAMWFVMIVFVRDFPAGTKEFFDAQHIALEKIGFWHALKKIVMNTQNWLGGAYTSLINLPIFLLGSTWGSWYLVQAQHLNAMDASYVTSMIFIGMILGSPALGWVSDKLKQRRMPMMVGALVSIAVIIAIMYVPHLTFTDLMSLFFMLGFVLGIQVLGYPLIAESNAALLTGTAEGLASTLIMGGGFFIPVFPALLNMGWNHQIQHGIPLYTIAEYHTAFFIMPIAFVFAWLAAFCIRETHCRALEDTSALEPSAAMVTSGGVLEQ